MKLHKVYQNEKSIFDRFGSHIDLIQDIKAVWNSEFTRKPDTWEALAVKFRDGISQTELLSLIVNIRADEYRGQTPSGYHVFWFD